MVNKIKITSFRIELLNFMSRFPDLISIEEISLGEFKIIFKNKEINMINSDIGNIHLKIIINKMIQRIDRIRKISVNDKFIIFDMVSKERRVFFRDKNDKSYFEGGLEDLKLIPISELRNMPYDYYITKEMQFNKERLEFKLYFAENNLFREYLIAEDNVDILNILINNNPEIIKSDDIVIDHMWPEYTELLLVYANKSESPDINFILDKYKMCQKKNYELDLFLFSIKEFEFLAKFGSDKIKLQLIKDNLFLDTIYKNSQNPKVMAEACFKLGILKKEVKRISKLINITNVEKEFRDYAIKNYYSTIKDIVISVNSFDELLILASKSKNEKDLKKLIKKGIDPRIKARIASRGYFLKELSDSQNKEIQSRIIKYYFNKAERGTLKEKDIENIMKFKNSIHREIREDARDLIILNNRKSYEKEMNKIIEEELNNAK